jgi:hypothetical protein
VSSQVCEDGKMANYWDFSDVVMKGRLHVYESASPRIHESVREKEDKCW